MSDQKEEKDLATALGKGDLKPGVYTVTADLTFTSVKPKRNWLRFKASKNHEDIV
jgi:hypothetical protein